MYGGNEFILRGHRSFATAKSVGESEDITALALWQNIYCGSTQTLALTCQLWQKMHSDGNEDTYDFSQSGGGIENHAK